MSLEVPSGLSGRVNICLVGCGYWGSNLARNFHNLGCLHAICESNPARLQAIREQYPAARIFTDLHEAVAYPEVHALALATPAELHYHGARAALEAGKDVFVEKPLTLDWREGMELVEIARRAGLILMVGHLLRYHPAVLKLQQVLAEGTLGKIEYIFQSSEHG